MTSTSAAHYVVDGSNIATEGRLRPSLEQLQEAVTTFMADHPKAMITVVVDATFGHRIDPSEKSEFDEAIANNELVAPPAGAIGRGDAFVLTIADRAGASVLSNDSFQEFHGDYEWLFDEGRLVGGKPVPHVGWVFVARTPVRGPVSRQATKKQSGPKRSASSSETTVRRAASKQASQPMPVPTSPPPGAAVSSKSSTTQTTSRPVSKSGEPVNDLIAFLNFVETSPVGTRCVGEVERYSSHGAYLRVGDVSVYVPLRLMADPPPNSARAQVKIGQEVGVTIVGFVADRRSIDAAFDGVTATTSNSGGEHLSGGRNQPTKSTASKKSAATQQRGVKKSATNATAATTTAKKAAAKTPVVEKAVAKTAVKKAAAKKAPATTSSTKTTPAKKVPVKKAPARKAPVKKAPVKKVAAKKASVKKAAAKKVATATRTRKADPA